MSRSARREPGVFLSHTSKDNDFAARLGNALAEHGVRVWIDEAEIKIGDSLLAKIAEGVEAMDYLAVILSPKSVASAWVQKEVMMAMTQEIQGRHVAVLPVLYRKCAVPLFLQDKVYADFTRQDKFAANLRRLLDAILPEGFEESILQAVRGAVEAEFEAYKRIPRISRMALDPYFTRDGSAREKIEDMLKRHRQKGWVLTNPGNPSTAELLDISLKNVENQRAEVETEEYWNLRWYDPKEGKEAYFYRKKNRQTYILLRNRRGVWRVDVNVYPGYSGEVRGVL
jgi:hypothetical protein